MKTDPKTLLLTLIILILGLSWLGVSSNKSKQMISSGYLNLCNLEQGNRGKVKGQIVKTSQRYGERFTSITEGSKGCTVVIKSKVGEPLLLSQLGEKIEATVKVENPTFLTLLNPNSVKTQSEVVGINGNLSPIHSKKVRFVSPGQLNVLKKKGGYVEGFYFKDSLMRRVKLNQGYRIFWNDNSTTVTAIEKL